MRFTLALLMALVASASGQAKGLQIEIHGKGGCPTRAAVNTVVRRQLAGLANVERSTLAIWRNKSAVTVVFHARDVTRRRSIDVGGSPCGEVVETIAFLARSWLSELPRVPLPSTARAPKQGRHAKVEPHRPAPEPVKEERPAVVETPLVVEAPVVPLPSPPPIPVTPPVTEAQKPPAVEEKTPPVHEVAPPPVAVPPVAPSAPLQLAALLSGGGHLGGDGHGGVEGSAAVELSRARWHLMAQGSWLSRINGSLGPGSITIDRKALSLLGSFAILERGRWGFDALGGVRVEHWSASSHGFSSTKTETSWVPGGTVGARARLSLGHRLWLFAAMKGSLLSSRSFEITHIDGGVTPSIFWLNADAGLGFQFW